MPFRNTNIQYGSMAKTLHWLIFFLVIGLLCAGFIMQTLQDKTVLKNTVYMIHKSFGLTVLILMVIRIFWAFTNSKPALSPRVPAWQKFAARSLHQVFYIVLIIMPLSGWLMSTAAGHPPSFFTLIKLPMPGVIESKPLAHFAHDIHTLLAWSIIVFVSLHILAALKHHFINKDNTLRSMLPEKLSRK